MDKYIVINTLASAPLTDAMKGNKLIILTSFGLICGDLHIPEPVSGEDIPTNDNIMDIFCHFISKEESKDKSSVNNNSILLKNVIIEYPDKRIKKLPSMFIFLDQIVGVTLGTVEKQ